MPAFKSLKTKGVAGGPLGLSDHHPQSFASRMANMSVRREQEKIVRSNVGQGASTSVGNKAPLKSKFDPKEGDGDNKDREVPTAKSDPTLRAQGAGLRRASRGSRQGLQRRPGRRSVTQTGPRWQTEIMAQQGIRGNLSRGGAPWCFVLC